MEKSNCKRPPDVNEALSSMLWTPYERPVQTSSSSSSSSIESLYVEEQERKRFNRQSNPLPNSMNWWNNPNQPDPQQHPSNRYSFPYYGNFFPPSRHLNNNVALTSTSVDVGNRHEQIIIQNTSPYHPTLVHSLTADDFYRYQVIKFENSFSFPHHSTLLHVICSYIFTFSHD